METDLREVYAMCNEYVQCDNRRKPGTGDNAGCP